MTVLNLGRFRLTWQGGRNVTLTLPSVPGYVLLFDCHSSAGARRMLARLIGGSK